MIQSIKIKDLPIEIIDGDRSHRYPKRSEFQEKGVLFLNTANIVKNRLDITEANFVALEKFNEIKKGRLQRFDIVITTRGSLGKVALFNINPPVGLINAQMLILRADDKVINPTFLFYQFCDDDFQARLKNFASGSAQPQIPIMDLKEIEVCVPSLETQRKIAAVLSTYDDLIENNTRRIKILEDMTQTLYQEWFVHFRFPGHESVPMVESPLGPIPQGWKALKYSDVVDLSRKGINPSKFPDEIFAHFSIPAFDSDCMPVLDRGDSIRSSKYLITEDCVLVSKLNPHIPRVWLPFLNTEHQAITSTEFLTLKPKSPVDCVFLFGLCRSPEFTAELAVRALGTSHSHQRVKPNDFLGMPVLIPTEFLLHSFREKVISMVNIGNTLRMKNANLRRTRDLLLPKLISGEIDVSELDIDTNGMQPVKSGTHIPYPLAERLHTDEKILGGKPVIKGTRLAVAFILDLLKQGWSEEEIVENYPSVAHEDIEACRAYEKKVTRASVSR